MKRAILSAALAVGAAAALALSLAAVAPAPQDTAPMTETQVAAVKRVKEMIEALNSGDYATIRAYFGAQSDPNGFVNALGRYHYSRGYDLLRVEIVPGADAAAGIVRNRMTGESAEERVVSREGTNLQPAD